MPTLEKEKAAALTREEIVRKQKQYIFPAVFTYFKEPLPLDRGEMQHVWDVDGKKYLDFFGGIVTVSVGHSNPRVTAKMKEQIDRLQHVSTCFPVAPAVLLAEKLASMTPGQRLTKTYFTNSGTEANETAVQTARMHTGNFEIIALRHGYSGRSSLARGMTGLSTWRRGTIQTSTSGQIAGLLAEPIQGVGGFITPPKEYFKLAFNIVKQYGGDFIADEVQTAWGRTGHKWFGIEHWEVVPDIITSAKGLANGQPIGVTIARPEAADALQGLTISTFGGNPVTTVTARAVIDVIEEDDLRTNAAVVGGYFRGKLEELQQKHALIGDVRGMGLLLAIELVTDRKTKEPAGAATNAILEAARERGLLIGKGGMHGNVLRMSPPLNISKADVDEAIRILDQSFTAVSAAR